METFLEAPLLGGGSFREGGEAIDKGALNYIISFFNGFFRGRNHCLLELFF